MKLQNFRSTSGATLLEVMLVLSIVALIILMSVRFYQATTNASITTQTLNVVQGIAAAADSSSLGSTNGYASATSTNLRNVGGPALLISPAGGTITVGTLNTSSYTITIPNLPLTVCNNVANKLKLQNTKFGVPTCGASGLVYTYNANS